MALTAVTWAAIKAKPTRGLIAVVDQDVSEHIYNWEVEYLTRAVYVADIEQRPTVHGAKIIDEVRVGGETSLVARASVALVDANPGSFYFDSTTSKLYIQLVDQTSPLYQTIYAVFPLRFTDGSHTRGRGVVLDSRQYWPYLMTAPSIARGVGTLYDSSLVAGSGTILFSAGDKLDEVCRRYVWSNRDMTVRIGGEDLPGSEYQTVFAGKTTSPSWTETSFSVGCIDYVDELEAKIPTLEYSTADADVSTTFTRPDTGATVTKAPSTIEAAAADDRIPVGNVKPIGIGAVKNITPIAMGLSASEGIYSITGHEVGAIDAVTVNGITSTEDSYDTASFLYYTAESSGLLYIARVDTAIDLRNATVTVSYSGVLNDDGTLMDNPADVVPYLIEQAGITRSVDAATLLESRFLCGLYDLRLHIIDQKAVREYLTTICKASGSFFFMDRDQEYRFITWCPDMRNEVEISENYGDDISFRGGGNIGATFSKVSVQYDYDPGRGSSAEWKTASVSRSEIRAAMDREETLNWSQQPLGSFHAAKTLAHRLCRYGASLPYTFEMDTTARLIDTELLQPVVIDRERIPEQNGLDVLHGRVIGVEVNASEGTAKLTIDDQRVLGRQGFMTTAAPTWWDTAEGERPFYGYYCDDLGLIEANDGSSFMRSIYW